MRLKIGVLVVGSLDWESKDYGGACRAELERHGRSVKPHRELWRQQRLMSDAASAFVVHVPIRYGRLSSSRGNTFTMVFSPEYQRRHGTAKTIQCKHTVSSFGDLLAEATELWVAESDEKHRGELSAKWGCIALVTPDDFLDQPDRKERQELLAAWAANVSKQPFYGDLGFSSEDEKAAKGPVIAGGRLRISWPTLTDGGSIPFDLLLATATNPEIGPGKKRNRYPSVKEIADAWNTRGHTYYFRCNRLTGIKTSDDSEIEKLLN